MVIMVDLDQYYREGDHAQIHEAESAENTGRASSLKSLKYDQNSDFSNVCNDDEIIALIELHNKNILVPRRWSLNTSLIS